MQANDGSMVMLQGQQFEQFLKGGNTNLCTIGDVFKIRHCYFVVENISEYGISAKGISKREYYEQKKLQRL